MDNGNFVMLNIIVVYIEVKDFVNNNVFFNVIMMIILNLYQGCFVGGVIGKVYYRDNDFGVDENGYIIMMQNLGLFFILDINMGYFFVLENIFVGNYGFFVCVIEKNRNQVLLFKVVFLGIIVMV